MRQKITRDIIQTVRIRSDKPSPVIDEVIYSMWEFLARTMEKDIDSAIYFRFLGTFYSNDKMKNKISKLAELKKLRNDSGQLQGE